VRILTGLSTLLVTAWVAAAPAAAAADARLRVDAGLGGFARPGRWMPVRVAVENGRGEIAGELVVEWGDARARRTVTLGSNARRQIDLLLRTPDVREGIVVRLVADGRTEQRIEMPVRIVRFDEPLVACIGATESARANAPACTVTLSADAAPASSRGYDAADDVVVQIDARSLPADRQRAIDLWRLVRTLDDSGGASRPREIDAADAVRPRLRAGFLLYLLAIPVVLVAIRRLSADARHGYAAVAVLVVVATSTAAAVGRAGPGSAVTIRHSAIAHQFPGSSRSLVLMRGSAEYPTAGRFEVRAPFADAAIETTGTRGTREDQRYDDDGMPVLSGRFALGARKVFALEGVADLPIVDVSQHATSVHVSNVSDRALEECQVTTDGAVRPVGTLAAGASLDIAGAAAQTELTVSCLAPASLLPFSATQHRVVTDGRLQLIVHAIVERRREP
jgi:hypothetical protein